MDPFDRSFQRAQYRYDNALPPEGPECCELYDDCAGCIERAEDAAETAAERRAEQAQEDRDNDYDREGWL